MLGHRRGIECDVLYGGEKSGESGEDVRSGEKDSVNGRKGVKVRRRKCGYTS